MSPALTWATTEQVYGLVAHCRGFSQWRMLWGVWGFHSPPVRCERRYRTRVPIGSRLR